MMEMSKAIQDRFDLVIVGSGFSGLCAAKTYLQVHPDKRVVVYEAERDLGGVWALDRIYPNLKTNNLFGHYEFSDFPSSKVKLDVSDESHIPGKAVNKYLSAYAEHFNLYQRLQFRHKVTTAEYVGPQGWLLKVDSKTESNEQRSYSVFTSKLIMASGLCCVPQMPAFDHIGGSDFGAPVFHGKEMASRPETFEKCKQVVVFGGTKMAWDAAYAYANAGAKVHWVIRASGHGPCWMAKAHVTPFKLRVEEMAMTRWLTWFSPCIWGGQSTFLESFCRRLLHKTWLGQRLVRGLFHGIQSDICSTNRYERNDQTAKLRPWVDFFWIAGGQGVLSFERDIFDMISDGRIEMHVDEITRLSNKTVHLRERKISADSLVCCTGWNYEPSVKFLPEGIDRELGLPHTLSEKADSLTKGVDNEILNELPVLRNQPIPKPVTNSASANDESRPNQPYRLYRFIAPAPPHFHDRSLAFVGFQINFGVPLTVQAQSLWATAYFDGKLSHLQQSNGPNTSESGHLRLRSQALDTQIKHETMLHTQFSRWRFPWGFGSRFPDFVFELLPYLDLIMTDLGLTPTRKLSESLVPRRKSWLSSLTLDLWPWISGYLRETFEPYGKADYIGITEEWIAATTNE